MRCRENDIRQKRLFRNFEKLRFFCLREKVFRKPVVRFGVTDNTYYRWRKEYGGVRTDQAKRLKELERENTRLKKLVAEAELDKAILREAASGNF